MSEPHIAPTVGRIVWYYPPSGDSLTTNGKQPLAAVVTCVWSDTCVNLTVFDANGNSQGRTSVLLVQPGNERPAGSFCEWMPYQKGQAAKTEAAEKKLAGA